MQWMRPAGALTRWRAGALKMWTPTATTLIDLAQYPTCDRLRAAVTRATLAFRSLLPE